MKRAREVTKNAVGSKPDQKTETNMVCVFGVVWHGWVRTPFLY